MLPMDAIAMPHLLNTVAIGTAPLPELLFFTGRAADCACAFSLAAGFGTSRISGYVK